MTSAIFLRTWTGAHFQKQQGTLIEYKIGSLLLQQWFEPEEKARWNVRLLGDNYELITSKSGRARWTLVNPAAVEELITFWDNQPQKLYPDLDETRDFMTKTGGCGVLHGQGLARLPA